MKEYKVVAICRSGFGSCLSIRADGKETVQDIAGSPVKIPPVKQQALNAYAKQGWRLAQAVGDCTETEIYLERDI